MCVCVSHDAPEHIHFQRLYHSEKIILGSKEMKYCVTAVPSLIQFYLVYNRSHHVLQCVRVECISVCVCVFGLCPVKAPWKV